MPEELDPKLAEELVAMALHQLPMTPSKHVLCTKQQLRECLLKLAGEAYSAGFLWAKREHFHSLGTAQRPAWMNTRRDDHQGMASLNIRLRPIVIRSLIGAGHNTLGDLCLVPHTNS